MLCFVFFLMNFGSFQLSSKIFFPDYRFLYLLLNSTSSCVCCSFCRAQQFPKISRCLARNKRSIPDHKRADQLIPSLLYYGAFLTSNMAAQTAKQFYFLIGLLFTITLRAPRYCFPFSSLIVCAPESAALQQAKLFPAAFHNTTQHSPHKGPVVPGTHTHPPYQITPFRARQLHHDGQHRPDLSPMCGCSGAVNKNPKLHSSVLLYVCFGTAPLSALNQHSSSSTK